MLTLLALAALAQDTPAGPPDSIDAEGTVRSLAPDTGLVEFDSRLASEIQLDGQTVAQLFGPATLTVRAPVGEHTVLVLTNGRMRSLTLDVSRSATAVVFIGRNGLTANARLEPLPEEEGIAPVELRVVGREEVLVSLGDHRYRILPGTSRSLTIPVGRHAMTVRSASGTVLWAKGHMEIQGTTPVIVQLTEGRMPEVSGSGSTFVAGS